MNDLLSDLQSATKTYGLLARAFDYPSPEIWTQLEGLSLNELMQASESISDEEHMARRVIPIRSQEQRELEYLAVFDHGGVPLYEGLCLNKDGREGINEELLRFYHHFGLKLDMENRDFPDSVVTELEFLMFLTGREDDAVAENRDPISYQFAQRDFLARHVVPWAEQLLKRLSSVHQDSVYTIVGLWVRTFVKAQLTSLQHQVGTDNGGAQAVLAQ